MTDSPVTVESLTKATMRMDCCLDCGDYYANSFTCIQYPELTKLHTGPRGRGKRPVQVTIRVNGVDAPNDLQAIADAINAYRSSRSKAPETPQNDQP